ncbi:hypothetical protein [uncultured Kordia sp.]|uniref:hypothetical protein n=1 Tax=uncultured Kordia sp. TaxID=507699 RepID=UPI0026189111|nr:hypothetical protein [uncultured Kordia sp.]
MKKNKKLKLPLNKSKISRVKGNTIYGGGETYPCPHTIGGTCTSTLPGSILGCGTAPSVFGGGCTHEQEK